MISPIDNVSSDAKITELQTVHWIPFQSCRRCDGEDFIVFGGGRGRRRLSCVVSIKIGRSRKTSEELYRKCPIRGEKYRKVAA